MSTEDTSMGIMLTPELLQSIMREAREGTLDAIREMRKPSEAEVLKQAEEAAKSMAMTLRRVDSARRQEERETNAWRNCSHRQPNGKTRFRGQGLSNGYAQAFCPECHFLSEPFQLAPHEITGGLNIGEWNGDVFALVQQRVRNSPPAPPIPDLPAGARVIF